MFSAVEMTPCIAITCGVSSRALIFVISYIYVSLQVFGSNIPNIANVSNVANIPQNDIVTITAAVL